MTVRVCIEAGCPALTRTTRCRAHERARDTARGTRQQRGYDADYDRAHRDYQRRLDAGEVFWCWRCPELSRPAHVVDGGHWHLGHSNEDRAVIRGPQCPESNLNTASQGSSGTPG